MRLRLSPEALYLDVVIQGSQEAMAGMNLELLKSLYEFEVRRREEGKLQIPKSFDYHPAQDKLLPMELDFLGKLIECIEIQRSMVPLREELQQHYITLQHKASLS